MNGIEDNNTPILEVSVLIVVVLTVFLNVDKSYRGRGGVIG